MDFSSVCRTCLSKNSLNPLFKVKDDHEIFSEALYVATGVRIQYKDSLPQNMCANCITKLNNTFKFRRQCSDTEKKLLEQIKNLSNSLQIKNEIDEDSFNNDNLDDSIDNDGKNIDTIDDRINMDEKNIDTIDDRINMDEKNIDAIDDSIDMIEKNIDTIKDENILLNDYDIEDDIPLNLLTNPQTSELKTSLKEEPVENIPVFDTTSLETDSNLKLEVKVIKVEKLDIEPTQILSTTTINMDNGTEKLNDSVISAQNTVTNIKSESEKLYEVLMDSITEKSTKVLCKLCNKQFSLRSIDYHMNKRHPGADKRKIQCELCDRYVLKEKLNRHMLLMHGSGKIKCGHCKLEFISKEELVKHVATCSAKKRKRKINETGRELRACDVCHKMMQKASLRMHKAVKHAGLKPVCEHCGRSFGNKFRLHEHYRAKHGYEKFRCNHCDFRSASAMAMKNHERRHRDEKPYVCDECGSKFHAAYLLAQHKQSHRKEKTVKCDLCPSTFKANNSLHMHKLTCHSNTTYKCNICNRSYKCRHYAVKHIRQVHRYTGTNPPLTVQNKNVEKTG